MKDWEQKKVASPNQPPPAALEEAKVSPILPCLLLLSRNGKKKSCSNIHLIKKSTCKYFVVSFVLMVEYSRKLEIA